jgi:pyridoxine 4-dehydrogenase
MLRPMRTHPCTILNARAVLDIDRTKIGTLDVSSMGMGTLNWPLDKKEDRNAEEALRACIAGGVNLFDTAEAYGFGTSEILTRNCVAATSAPAIIATKFAPVPWRRRPEDVVDACRASAARLGVESIDLYQIHWPDIIQPLKPLGIEECKVCALVSLVLLHAAPKLPPT